MGARLRLAMVMTLVGASACDSVFSLAPEQDDGTRFDAAEPYDRCVMSGIDDPLRYASLANPKGPDEKWSWEEARSECLLLGMDLAVFNDEHELGQVQIETTPYWTGQTLDSNGWSAVDGCDVFAPSTETTSATKRCGAIISVGTLGSESCDGTMPADVVMLGAACEAPRPMTEDCLPNRPDHATYTISPRPMNYADGEAFCASRDAHVVEINSHEEWLKVASIWPEVDIPRFWLGTAFDGTSWSAKSGCPAVYSWADGRPELAPGQTCATSRIADLDGDDATEIIGMESAECADAGVYTVCESD